MRVGIAYGLEHLDLDVRDEALAAVTRRPPDPPLPDPAEAVRAALEAPQGFPPLRRALTPDDHVVVVLDQHLPDVAGLLTPVLEHVASADVAPSAITLLCQPHPEARADWLDRLPDAFEEVRVEIHDPHDRKHLSYLATTRQGRRLYLNRTAVDADQLVVLGRVAYDPLLGYAGGEADLYPALSDAATRQAWSASFSLDAPTAQPWPVRREAAEAAWLLGAPFLIQVVEGAGDEVLHVVAGLADTAAEGQRLLDARWRVTVAERVDTVVASVSGAPGRQGFADLARALACAARVVKPQGRIALLTRARPELLGPVDWIRQAEDPAQALKVLQKKQNWDTAAALQWAGATHQATVYLLSGLEDAAAEELFTVPFTNPAQVQRLVNAGGSCLFLPDAHKTLAVVAGAARAESRS